MAIAVKCSGCGEQYEVDAEFAGQQMQCQCGAVVTVPAAAPKTKQPSAQPKPKASATPPKPQAAAQQQPAQKPRQKTPPPSPSAPKPKQKPAGKAPPPAPSQRPAAPQQPTAPQQAAAQQMPAQPQQMPANDPLGGGFPAAPAAPQAPAQPMGGQLGGAPMGGAPMGGGQMGGFQQPAYRQPRAGGSVDVLAILVIVGAALGTAQGITAGIIHLSDWFDAFDAFEFFSEMPGKAKAYFLLSFFIVLLMWISSFAFAGMSGCSIADAICRLTPSHFRMQWALTWAAISGLAYIGLRVFTWIIVIVLWLDAKSEIKGLDFPTKEFMEEVAWTILWAVVPVYLLVLLVIRKKGGNRKSAAKSQAAGGWGSGGWS